MIIIRRDNNEDIGKDKNRNRDKSYIKVTKKIFLLRQQNEKSLKKISFLFM